MVREEEVAFSLTVNVDKAESQLRKIYTIVYQFLGLLRLLGLPLPLDAAIMKLQRLIMVMNQARLAAIALQTASGPVGWALAGIGITTAFITTGQFIVGDLFYDEQRGT